MSNNSFYLSKKTKKQNLEIFIILLGRRSFKGRSQDDIHGDTSRSSAKVFFVPSRLEMSDWSARSFGHF